MHDAVRALELHGGSEDGGDLAASAIEFYDAFAAIEASIGRASARREIVTSITARGFSQKDAEEMIDQVGHRGAIAKAIRQLGSEKKTPPPE